MKKQKTENHNRRKPHKPKFMGSLYPLTSLFLSFFPVYVTQSIILLFYQTFIRANGIWVTTKMENFSMFASARRIGEVIDQQKA